MKFVCVAIVAGLLLARVVEQAHAQESSSQHPNDTATVSGRITAAEDGAPLPRAVVELLLPGGFPSRTLLTDDAGRYVFTEVPAGRYTVRAGGTGYLVVGYGERLPGDGRKVIEVKDGESVKQIDVALPHGGVIEVLVTDETGEPRPNVSITPMRCRAYGGRIQRVETRELAFRGPFRTNDLGRVRIFGLAPGDYCISAYPFPFGSAVRERPGPGHGRLKYLPRFYPGTTSLEEAQSVTLAVGQEAYIQLPIWPSPVARVSGRVVTADGAPVTSGWIRMKRAGESDTHMMFQSRSLLSPRGFEFREIPPGDYVLETSPSTENTSLVSVYGKLPIRVGEDDLSDLVITATKAARVQGRIVFDGDPSRIFKRDGNFSLYVKPGYGQVSLDDNGRFSIIGVTGDGILGWIGTDTGPAGWYLKAVMHGDEDITDTPLDVSGAATIDDIRVIITHQHTTVDGEARNANNLPVLDYDAVIFSDDPGRWTPGSRFVKVPYPADGRFTQKGLPPGRYRAVAVPPLGSMREDALTPAMLQRLRDQAVSFTLGEGEHKTLTVPYVNF